MKSWALAAMFVSLGSLIACGDGGTTTSSSAGGSTSSSNDGGGGEGGSSTSTTVTSTGITSTSVTSTGVTSTSTATTTTTTTTSTSTVTTGTTSSTGGTCTTITNSGLDSVLGPADDAGCASCLGNACCDSASACTDSTSDCVKTALPCINGCDTTVADGGKACEQACIAGPGGSDLEAFISCFQQDCSDECMSGSICGSGYAHNGEPGCDTCLNANCCDSFGTCDLSDPTSAACSAFTTCQNTKCATDDTCGAPRFPICNSQLSYPGQDCATCLGNDTSCCADANACKDPTDPTDAGCNALNTCISTTCSDACGVYPVCTSQITTADKDCSSCLGTKCCDAATACKDPSDPTDTTCTALDTCYSDTTDKGCGTVCPQGTGGAGGGTGG